MEREVGDRTIHVVWNVPIVHRKSINRSSCIIQCPSPCLAGTIGGIHIEPETRQEFVRRNKERCIPPLHATRHP